MLISLSSVLSTAIAGNYAVGSFNVANFEMMHAVIKTAAACQSPVIVSTVAAEARYLDPAVAHAMAFNMAKKYEIPIVLHLDHGDSFDLAVQCIQAGYSSVMYDGSHDSLDENIRVTKEVVRVARTAGASVEGEIGRIQGVEDAVEVDASEAQLSDVDEAVRFARETGVDALAVAIGNAHGFYLEEPKLDFERLKEIRQRTAVPIVLHGGTGIPRVQIRKAILLGIAKINIAAKIRRSYLRAVHSGLSEQPETTDVRGIMQNGIAAMCSEIKESMEMMSSVGKLADIK